MQSIKRFKNRETIVSISLIILVSILAYAPLMSQLGYYKEDWYMLWAGLVRGNTSLIEMFMADRPFHGYWYAFLFSILKEAALPWYIFALGIRITCGFVYLWLFRLLWPEKKLESTIAALLVTIYPGFIQQAQAIGFEGHFIALLTVLLSVTLTVYALKTTVFWKKWTAQFFAITLLIIYPLLLEYYIGFEGVRLLLMGYVIYQPRSLKLKKFFKKVILCWLPYLITIVSFLYWRLFIFSGERRTTNVGVLVDTYASNPLLMLPRILVALMRDIIETIYMAWSVPLNNFFYQGSFKEMLFSWGVAFLAVIMVGLFFILYRKVDQAKTESKDSSHLIWLGALIVVITLIPAILANRDVEFVGREDRFSLPASIGVGMLVVGLVFQFFQNRSRKAIILFIIWISVLTQLNFALWMREYWDFEKDVWWQISWRVPQFEEGTVLLFDQPAEKRIIEDYEVWTPANIIFYPDSSTPLISGEMLYDSSVMHEVLRGADKPFIYRRIPVERDFGRVLVISMPSPQSCVNLIDGNKSEISMLEEPIVHMAAPFSRIDLIQTNAEFRHPPESIFGPEPPHTWCYFYQKASFARQIGDWDEIARLGAEVQSQGLGPYDYYEWMPFFEGYANLGMQKEAKNLAKIIKTEFGSRNQICQSLENLSDYPDEGAYDLIMELLCR